MHELDARGAAAVLVVGTALAGGVVVVRHGLAVPHLLLLPLFRRVGEVVPEGPALVHRLPRRPSVKKGHKQRNAVPRWFETRIHAYLAQLAALAEPRDYVVAVRGALSTACQHPAPWMANWNLERLT